MNTDIQELRKIINVPDGLVSCEWQTGEFAQGADWWLAAVLEFDSGKVGSFAVGEPTEEFLQTPPGMVIVGSFGELNRYASVATDDESTLGMVVETYTVAPFESSPLLNGKLVKLSDEKAFVYMWTN